MGSLTDRVIHDELSAYGVLTTTELCSRIRAYISLLLHWNRRISLTTVTDPIEILRFHFGESMFAASAVLKQNGRLADVGSGAGFPGIPLKLAIPALDVVLIESNAKKAAFLSECVRELGISGVQVHRGRFEDLDEQASGFDFITARALGTHEELVRWSRRAIRENGSIFLWLGERDAAEVSGQSAWRWSKPSLIPGSHSRVLLVGVAA